MRTAPDDRTLAEMLPGRWVVAASNFPMWLRGDRLNPVIEYGLISAQPLVLSDTVSYTKQDGAAKTVVGVDKWRGAGFLWRGKGLLRIASSSWTVPGVTEDGNVAVIRFSKSFATPAGIDVLVREGAPQPELRARVAGASERFGLSAEDFASLAWLAPESD